MAYLRGLDIVQLYNVQFSLILLGFPTQKNASVKLRIEDAQEWLESVVKPFRMKWELQAMTKQLVGTSAKIARLETQLKVAMEALKLVHPKLDKLEAQNATLEQLKVTQHQHEQQLNEVKWLSP